MSKIKSEDSGIDIITKMSEGNPGAVSVLCQLLEHGQTIDPKNAMGSMGPILMMDSLHIYGPRILMLYKDVCGEDLVKTIACVRACQMGKITETKLNKAIDNRGEGLDTDEILTMMRSIIAMSSINSGSPSAEGCTQ